MLTIRSVQFATLLTIAMAAAAIAQTSAPEARAGGGCHEEVTDEATNSVAMTEGCFVPSVARIEPGQSVTWGNESGQRHSLTGQNASWGLEYELSRGDSASLTFDEAGTYAYYCIIHPGMIGVVVVGDGKGAGSVARADAGGGEVLASVPETSEEPELVAPSSSATAESGSETDWLALSGIALAGLVAGGAAVAVVRRR